MTSKTAMQQLIEKLNDIINKLEVGEKKASLIASVHFAEQLLATEKQQHIETFNAGTKTRYMKAAKEMGLETLPEGVETGEQYYNQTYGQ